MRTGDGLLVRLRITGGIVPAGLAKAIAEASHEFGNGLIDLSARANLQVRGVSEKSLPGLIDRLEQLGLLDQDPDAESVRNVIASPLAGLDTTALIDIRPIVRELERTLAGDRALHALPGKFGFLVDDGGAVDLASVAIDVRFEAFQSAAGVAFAVQAGGDALSAHPVTTCLADDVPSVAAALARAFLELRHRALGQDRRMASLVDRVGPQRLAQAAGLVWSDPSRWCPAPHPFGAYGWMSAGDLSVLGVGAPFGRWSADDLQWLAGVSDQHGLGELRLTPYRALLIPGVAPDSVSADALRARFITSADDPRLAVAACPGAPACGNATTRTHDDALALATLARRITPSGLALHVSGCAKGCAHPGSAPLTLVGVDGAYDLVAGGAAADEPVRRGLAVGAVAALLEEQVRTGKELDA
jgi:precorrin-3B synthase